MKSIETPADSATFLDTALHTPVWASSFKGVSKLSNTDIVTMKGAAVGDAVGAIKIEG